MADAMSLGTPILPNGWRATDACSKTSLANSPSVIGVRTRPGATTLTRTPHRAYVAAADRANPSTPALAAAIAS